MRLIFLYIFINNKFIKNSEYPICKNCRYYLKDELFPTEHLSSRCALFGEQDVITGTITNYYVDRVRSNDKLCGIKGNFFKAIEENNNI